MFKKSTTNNRHLYRNFGDWNLPDGADKVAGF
jgi:hypothetical protein